MSPNCSCTFLFVGKKINKNTLDSVYKVVVRSVFDQIKHQKNNGSVCKDLYFIICNNCKIFNFRHCANMLLHSMEPGNCKQVFNSRMMMMFMGSRKEIALKNTYVVQ